MTFLFNESAIITFAINVIVLKLLLLKERTRFITITKISEFVSRIFFAATLISLLVIVSVSPIWAVQLDAKIGTHAQTAQPTFKFLRTVFIEYPDGGQIADLLKGKEVTVNIDADSNTPGVSDLIAQLNSNLARDLQSTVQITDMKINYRTHLQGRGDSASIDFRVIMIPTIKDYVLRPATDTSAAIVDSHWRGLFVKGPVILKTQEYGDIDINQPIGYIKTQFPELYSKMAGSKAESMLGRDLIDAGAILAQPLSTWHHLFDPSGTISQSSQFGYSGEKLVITSFTMGESSLREGIQKETEQVADFTTDKKYVVRAVESSNSANIQLDGFVTETSIDKIEYFGSSSKVPEDTGTTSTGGFPVGVIYGMAGAGAAVAVIVLFVSDRKLKKQQQQK